MNEDWVDLGGGGGVQTSWSDGDADGGWRMDGMDERG
jgi:hypothetical protein